MTPSSPHGRPPLSPRRRLALPLALMALFLGPGALVALRGPERAAALPLAQTATPSPTAGPTAAPVASPSPSPSPTPRASREDLEAGRRRYLQQCATCHGLQGEGIRGLGPPIGGLGPAHYDFTLSTGRMPLDRPVRQAPRKPPLYDQREIAQLVAYLVTLPPGGGVPIPDVRLERGNLSRGQGLYQLHCAPCHGATGLGGAMGNYIAPGLDRATALQVAEAVRVGPGPMPVFDEETISPEQLDSLVRYVVYLRDPESRGGATLAKGGPIVEGIVALLFGLGAVALVTRVIGARA